MFSTAAAPRTCVFQKGNTLSLRPLYTRIVWVTRTCGLQYISCARKNSEGEDAEGSTCCAIAGRIYASARPLCALINEPELSSSIHEEISALTLIKCSVENYMILLVLLGTFQ